MVFSGFENLSGWKDFERLCADLLNAEGFVVESEPFVDRTGVDIVAVEEYRSHDPDRVIHVTWRIQCKHYADSGKNLGRKEAEESLYSYEVNRKPDEGLFLIVDTDYSEPAKDVIDGYVSQHPDARVVLWNQRQLVSRLERHPHLLARYGLALSKPDYVSVLAPLAKLGPVRTLLISDQSVLAHNLASALGAAGFDLVFLPFWNYTDPMRMALMQRTVLEDDFRLVICFLGDSFGFPLPDELVEVIHRCHENGAGLLLFPFLAWSLNQGLYPSLRKIVPVRLQDFSAFSSDQVTIEMLTGSFRRGDFKWLLRLNPFAEDEYTECDPINATPPFAAGIGSPFGLSHTFEYLTVTEGSQIAWADTNGNPVVVVDDSSAGKVCYLNTCCHSCLSPVAISSPLEASAQVGFLFRNIIQWLFE